MLYDFLKRIIDIIGAIVAIILLSPIFVIIAVAIKLETPGPILADTPKRVGKDGKLFLMYKFRSMVQNALELLEKDPKLKAEYKKNSYKISDDPRVTKVGKFLRKYSLDEFPQFFNVLIGNMSLVGPRAYYPFELEEQQNNFPNTKENVGIILSGKPGATGLWQVSGRSNITFEKRVELDAYYIKKRSIFFDLWIIIQTIPAVLSGRGAV